jgi:RNA polymerase sigma-70 factor (ECF subfamily)
MQADPAAPMADATSQAPPTSNLPEASYASRAAEPDAGELTRAAAGDPAAFRALVERYQHLVFGCAYTVLGDRQDAEDAAQDAFLRLHRSLGGYRGEAQFTTWLFRLAVSAAVDHRRRRQRRFSAAATDAMPEVLGRPDVSAGDRERARRLLEAMAELPPAQRAPLALREVYGYEYGEIAALLGRPVGTVKAAVHRGRQALREALERREG